MTINPIIKDKFHGVDGTPKEILEIIDTFFEIEDSATYSESSKEKLYDQTMQEKYVKLDKEEKSELLNHVEAEHSPGKYLSDY